MSLAPLHATASLGLQIAGADECDTACPSLQIPERGPQLYLMLDRADGPLITLT